MKKKRHHSCIKKQSVNLRLMLFCSVVFNCKKLSALYKWLSSIDGYIPFRRNFPLSFSISISFVLYRTHSRSLYPSLFQFNWQPPRVFTFFFATMSCVSVCDFCWCWWWCCCSFPICSYSIWVWIRFVRFVYIYPDWVRYRFDCLGLVLCCTHIGMRWAVSRCHDVATVKANPNISKACFNIHPKLIGKGDALSERKL